MEKAIIYIRVSTEEQSKHGYSLTGQENSIRQFCAQREYAVVNVYKDNVSGQDFDRPGFKALYEYLISAAYMPNVA